MSLCPCGSSLDLESCCQPIINLSRQPSSALELMRARYTAYTQGAMDFIWNSTHPDHRDTADRQAMETWSATAQWKGLEIIDPGQPNVATQRLKDEVEFKVLFDINEKQHIHHERSQFSFANGQWWFVDGTEICKNPVNKPIPYVNTSRCGRNDPCLCGSGKKFKKCCGLQP